MLNYATYVWKNVPGPKVAVIIMSIIVGFANGAMLSAINSAISARVDGTFHWTHPALFFAAVAAFFIGGYFAMYRATDMAERFVQRLRESIVERVGAASLRQVELYGRGDIYAHLTRDTHTVGTSWVRLVKAFQAAIVVIFCLAYLIWLSPLVFLITLVLIVIGVQVFFVQERKARRHLRQARKLEAEVFGGMADLLDGFKETKLNRAVSRDLLGSLEDANSGARRNFVQAEFLFYSTSIISRFMLFGLLGLIAFLPASWFGASSALAFQILALLLYLVPSLEQVVDLVGPFLRAEVARQNLERLEATLAEEVAGRAGPESFDSTLTLDGVTLEYDGAEPGSGFTLGPIDMTVKPGEIVFLVGGNGSGKTTLMKVIAGLYPPDGGEVRVGDTALTSETVGSWREMVASVFHDFHLFDRAFGLDLDEARPLIEAELERVGLAEKVSLHPDGRLSTTRLSTGQRKRLALVLARAQRRPLLLLDEFGAEQDPEFRAFFYTDYLEALRAEGITVIAVTHDDRYFGTCDRLIKLDLGRVVHDGPPAPSGSGLSFSEAQGA